MQDFISSLGTFFEGVDAANVVRAAAILLVGLVLARLVSAGVVRLLSRQADAHHRMIIRRIAFYLVAGIFVASALVQLGFNFGILLGAAGILTVALGFASQTSATNIISGLFLLGEKAFAVGDVIRVGTTTGEVLSIDLLSVKLRTFDNLYVRVANENLIKSEITNLTRFPIRRLDIQIGVAYKEDLRQVFDVLYRVAEQNPLSLDEPKPIIIYQGFGDSALNFQFSVWIQRENWFEMKTRIHVEIKEAFDEAGIEIPFPHRTLYTGSVTDPFPIRLVRDEAVQSESDGV
jgi:small-conductance mechanosensitive channel